MELKEGYKQTDIGIIPQEWEVFSYDEVFKFLKTASFSRDELTKNDEIEYVHYGDIHTKFEHFLNFSVSLLPSINENKAKRYSFIQEGDLIMADASEDYSGIGKGIEVKNLGEKKAIAGLHTYLLRDKNNYFSDGFKAYLHSNLLIKKQIDRLATGLKVFGISKNNLKLVQIPTPSVIEQKAIAQALSDTDALITALDALIAKKRLIKQGTMQELLTGERRLEGFTEGWDEEQLSELTILMTNGFVGIATIHYTDSDNGITYIQGFNVEENSFNLTGIKKVTEEFHKKHLKSCLQAGDLLTVQTGDIGVTTIVSKELEGANCHALIITRFKKGKAFPHFYSYYFNSEIGRKRLKEIETGSTMKHINVGDMISVYVPTPTVAEQKAIAQILSDMDTEIATLEAKRNKYKQVKQGMMQELLTGKTRLTT